jgi:hypothetical protein
MVVDPRRRRAHIFARRLRRLLTKHDEYIHPDLAKKGRKPKKYIPLIDLTTDHQKEQKSPILRALKMKGTALS